MRLICKFKRFQANSNHGQSELVNMKIVEGDEPTGIHYSSATIFPAILATQVSVRDDLRFTNLCQISGFISCGFVQIAALFPTHLSSPFLPSLPHRNPLQTLDFHTIQIYFFLLYFPNLVTSYTFAIYNSSALICSLRPSFNRSSFFQTKAIPANLMQEGYRLD